MDGIGRNDIHVFRFQPDICFWQMKHGLPLFDIEDTNKGGTHFLPVPICMMRGIAYVQHHQIHGFNRYLYQCLMMMMVLATKVRIISDTIAIWIGQNYDKRIAIIILSYSWIIF